MPGMRQAVPPAETPDPPPQVPQRGEAVPLLHLPEGFQRHLRPQEAHQNTHRYGSPAAPKGDMRVEF